MLIRWGAHKKRSQNIIIVMVHRGRDPRRTRRSEGVKDVNDLATMVRTIMAKIDEMEIA
jgi:hypothetical protein